MCKYFHYLHFAVLLIAFVICTQSYVVFGEDCEPPDYFECKSGQCIRRNYVCNNVTDCDDNSDEDGDCGKNILIFKVISNESGILGFKITWGRKIWLGHVVLR